MFFFAIEKAKKTNFCQKISRNFVLFVQHNFKFASKKHSKSRGFFKWLPAYLQVTLQQFFKAYGISCTLETKGMIITQYQLLLCPLN